MLLELSSGWTTEVERGPDWLFIKLVAPPDLDLSALPLADAVWDLMQNHLIRRIVLEMDPRILLQTELLNQLVRLQLRIRSDGGLLRLCGLSEQNRQVLKIVRLDELLPQYESREAALMRRPIRPR